MRVHSGADDSTPRNFRFEVSFFFKYASFAAPDWCSKCMRCPWFMGPLPSTRFGFILSWSNFDSVAYLGEERPSD